MMVKLKATQQRIEETKNRLDTVIIDEQSTDGQLKLTLTANSKVKSVEISNRLLEDKDQLENYLIVVMNKALEKAAKVNLEELDAVTKVDIPMIPGMEDMFR